MTILERSRSVGLGDLPLELVCMIVEHLCLQDSIHFAAVCRTFRTAVFYTPRPISLSCDCLQTAAPFLRNLHCIQCLHVHDCSAEILRQICTCICHAPRVRTVEMCCSSSACLTGFSWNHLIRKLELRETSISATCDTWNELTNLEVLVLRCPLDDSLVDDVFLDICAKLPGLKKLAVVGANALTDACWGVLDCCPNLTHLFLRGAHLDSIPDLRQTKLEWLDLSGSSLHNDSLRLTELPPLVHLGLEETEVSGSLTAAISSSTPISVSLKTLNLRDTAVNPSVFRVLRQFPALRLLDLGEAIDEDSIVHHLANQHPQLQVYVSYEDAAAPGHPQIRKDALMVETLEFTNW